MQHKRDSEFTISQSTRPLESKMSDAKKDLVNIQPQVCVHAWY
jgi:hypothetical protein